MLRKPGKRGFLEPFESEGRWSENAMVSRCVSSRLDNQEVTGDVDQNSANRRMCLLLGTIVCVFCFTGKRTP